MLGWNGDNYWTTLTDTVNQKRGLLNGTFGVYNSYTLLPIYEIQANENLILTEKRPNVARGQRVIVGNLQSFIYSIEDVGDYYQINIGNLSDSGVLSLLQQGAALKVDVPENRPFPFYRPEALASGDAEFRCSTGFQLPSRNIYERVELRLYPLSQENTVVEYRNIELYAGSYYYFDREVYLSADNISLIPWVLPEFIPEKGLWKLYVCPTFIGRELNIVWGYPDGENSNKVALCTAMVRAWKDPSDWGSHGDFFNPVLDRYSITKRYSTAGLNYSLGTQAWLSGSEPPNGNNVWFNSDDNLLYTFANNVWTPVGSAVDYIAVQDNPPTAYQLNPGTIWQSASNNLYIWDPYRIPPTPSDFFTFSPYIFIDNWSYFLTELVTGGFYEISPDNVVPAWNWIRFFSQDLQDSNWAPAYAGNLYLLVNGEEIPNYYLTTDYNIVWEIKNNDLEVTYLALTPEGEYIIPQIQIKSRNGAGLTLNITNDFREKENPVDVLPYNEIGVLNNFRGVWGNKGGARSMDLCFDALDIHGFNEREALWLDPISEPVDFDFLLSLVSANQVYVGDTAPPAAELGDLYFNNETGALALYYEDEDRKRWWVEVDLPTLPSPFAPAKPVLSTGGCLLNQGDMWLDNETGGITIFYESPSDQTDQYDALAGDWVQVNWKYDFSQAPDPIPDYNAINVYVGDYPKETTLLSPGVNLETDDYVCSYFIDADTCSFIFQYEAKSDAGMQNFPKWWVGPKDSATFPLKPISDYVYSNLRFVQAACVQNAESTLRPWKNQDLEVTTLTDLVTDTFFNPLLADVNKGPGDVDFLKSFVRLPSEYGRDSKKWQQTQLVMQDMAYFGSYQKLYPMRCPLIVEEPEIYEEVYFYGNDPTGKLLYSESYLYSDAEGFNDPYILLPERDVQKSAYQDADFDFTTDKPYDSWTEAGIAEYAPLHYRQVDNTGEWRGVYVEGQGTQALTGFVEQDLAGKTVTVMPPPVWDASIYKYAPLCPFGEETYMEDANNFKVNYAYFSADLAAAEDGFFDPQSDVAWRQPLNDDQTLYITRN